MRARLPLILSTTALLVAVFGSTPLGKAAYQALAPNSIGAEQIRNAAVTNPKLRGDAVTSGKVLNGSLRAVDFKAGQLPAGPEGEKGDRARRATREPRATRDSGQPRPQRLRDRAQVDHDPAQYIIQRTGRLSRRQKVIGGAASIQGVPSNATTIHTNLTLDRFYDAHYVNTSAQPRQLNAVAICALVTP